MTGRAHHINLRPDLRKEAWGKTPMLYQGEAIGASDQPEYAAARWLLDNGAAEPEDRLETYRGEMLCMSGIVGKLAKWMVVELASGAPTFQLRPYVPFSTVQAGSQTAEKPFHLASPRRFGGWWMTRRLLPIRTVLEGKDWLGSLIGKPSFRMMRVLLIASMGEELSAEELETFTSVTGRTEAPSEPVEELWIAAGRRSGKSMGVAVAAAYLAACCDYRDVLARGERGDRFRGRPSQRRPDRRGGCPVPFRPPRRNLRFCRWPMASSRPDGVRLRNRRRRRA